MSSKIAVLRGSGNVFRDLGEAYAELEQMRARLAAGIIRVLDARGLTTRAAEVASGTAAADFSRIRRARTRSLHY